MGKIGSNPTPESLLEAINRANKLEDKQEIERILMINWGFCAQCNKKIFMQTETHPKLILLTTLAA